MNSPYDRTKSGHDHWSSSSAVGNNVDIVTQTIGGIPVTKDSCYLSGHDVSLHTRQNAKK